MRQISALDINCFVSLFPLKSERGSEFIAVELERECKQLSFSLCPFLCQRQIPIIANEVLRLLTASGTVAEADNVETFRLISKV